MVADPTTLETILAGHLASVAPGPADLVFPGDPQDHPKAYHAFKVTLKDAGLARATMHDARHTFGVQTAQAGVPVVRLQKLMGHATLSMTMRYMAHAPEASLDEDAAAIDRHMDNTRTRGSCQGRGRTKRDAVSMKDANNNANTPDS